MYESTRELVGLEWDVSRCAHLVSYRPGSCTSSASASSTPTSGSTIRRASTRACPTKSLIKAMHVHASARTHTTRTTAAAMMTTTTAHVETSRHILKKENAAQYVSNCSRVLRSGRYDAPPIPSPPPNPPLPTAGEANSGRSAKCWEGGRMGWGGVGGGVKARSMEGREQGIEAGWGVIAFERNSILRRRRLWRHRSRRRRHRRYRRCYLRPRAISCSFRTSDCSIIVLVVDNINARC